MRFLQIGDLHLGKKLYEFSLYEDQVAILNTIIKVLETEHYDALLITGDIYESSSPSPQATMLFGKFLEDIKSKFPRISVFIISGNHDSSIRLLYASEIFKTNGIYIQGEFSKTSKPILLANGSEQVAVHLLPFLNQSMSAVDGKTNCTQAEILKEALTFARKTCIPNVPNILLAHAFVLPDSAQPSEEEYRGTAQLVPASYFEGFDYVALGHIHRAKKITEQMYYAGSPFAYSFDEVEGESYKKYAIKIEINCAEKKLDLVEFVELAQPHRLLKLEGDFSDFIATDKFDKFRDCYLQIELLNDTSVESPMQLLQKKFPFLMNIKQKAFERMSNFLLDEVNLTENVENNFENIFTLFCSDINATFDEDELALAKEFWNIKE